MTASNGTDKLRNRRWVAYRVTEGFLLGAGTPLAPVLPDRREARPSRARLRIRVRLKRGLAASVRATASATVPGAAKSSQGETKEAQDNGATSAAHGTKRPASRVRARVGALWELPQAYKAAQAATHLRSRMPSRSDYRVPATAGLPDRTASSCRRSRITRVTRHSRRGGARPQAERSEVDCASASGGNATSELTAIGGGAAVPRNARVAPHSRDHIKSRRAVQTTSSRRSRQRRLIPTAPTSAHSAASAPLPTSSRYAR